MACLCALLLGCLSLAGCLRDTHGPMATLEHPVSPDGRARRLMILLPGIGDEAADYARHGLVASAQARGLDADLIAVDAHYGYYARDEIQTRLFEEIILPARTEYDEVWLVGISLGGLGAILTAREHPEAIDGLVLLAPYLGPSHMPRTIIAEGGMRAWEPPPPPARYDWDVELWSWLKRYEDPSEDLPPLYLAYGREDSFAPAHGVLADILPSERVVVSDGGHIWTTWAGLWDEMVSDGLHRLLRPRNRERSPLDAPRLPEVMAAAAVSAL